MPIMQNDKRAIVAFKELHGLSKPISGIVYG